MKIPYVPCLLALILFMLAALLFFGACYRITLDDLNNVWWNFFLSLGALALGLRFLYDGRDST